MTTGNHKKTGNQDSKENRESKDSKDSKLTIIIIYMKRKNSPMIDQVTIGRTIIKCKKERIRWKMTKKNNGK